jgi:glutamyl-tRNA reductase
MLERQWPLDSHPRPLILIDIAQPRDVEEGAEEIDGIRLFTVDNLRTISETTLQLRKGEIEQAQQIIDEELGVCAKLLRRMSADNMLASLYTWAEAIRVRERDRALNRIGTGDPRMAASLVQAFPEIIVGIAALVVLGVLLGLVQWKMTRDIQATQQEVAKTKDQIRVYEAQIAEASKAQKEKELLEEYLRVINDLRKQFKLAKQKIVRIDAVKIGKEVFNRPIHNTTMMGAVARATGFVKPESIIDTIRERALPQLERFTEKIIEQNSQAIRRGYEEAIL